MKLSIATCTARREPNYSWLLDGLAAQAEVGDELELVIIDLLERSPDDLVPNFGRVDAIAQVVIAPPKPNPWQGRYRVTKRDVAAVANARNTALCLVTHDYVAFVDDSTRLGDGWLAAVRRAAARPDAGAVVQVGPIERGKPGDARRETDDRWRLYPRGKRGCPAYFLYGGNACMPLSLALEVGGFEEATDPVGRQDLVMGHMLAHAGRRIDFDPSMRVVQDRRLYAKPTDDDMHPLPRVNRGNPPRDKATVIEQRYGALVKTSDLTPDIAQLRAAIQRGEPFPIHTVGAEDPDWFDCSPIGDT